MAEVLFDIGVVDTDNQSCVHQTFNNILTSTEKEKVYYKATSAQYASFSPFVVSVDGYIRKKAKVLLSQFTDKNWQIHKAWGCDGMGADNDAICNSVCHQYA